MTSPPALTGQIVSHKATCSVFIRPRDFFPAHYDPDLLHIHRKGHKTHQSASDKINPPPSHSTTRENAAVPSVTLQRHHLAPSNLRQSIRLDVHINMACITSTHNIYANVCGRHIQLKTPENAILCDFVRRFSKLPTPAQTLASDTIGKISL